jgi:uncharacterized protein with HEPN domain
MRDQAVFIEDALESLDLACEYVEKVDFQAFCASKEKQDSVTYRVAMLGEALGSVDDALKDAHAEIPWRAITGMRNILVHDYGNIDLKRVWDTVKNDLPDLRVSLVALMSAL